MRYATPWTLPLIPLTLALTGCSGSWLAPQPAVIPYLIVASPVANNQVTLTGKPGALVGNPYAVTITVVREGGYSGYRTQHLSTASLPIVSGFALAAPDGSFVATTLGDAVNAVKPGDEVNFRPVLRSEVPGTSVQMQDAGELVYFPLK